MKGEWGDLLKEFTEYFMTSTVTVTFVDDQGTPKTPKVTDHRKTLDEGQFSKVISDALHLKSIIFKFQGSHDPVYHYPSNPYRKWLYFELIGGHKHCTMYACFGFLLANECLVIVKPISQPDPKSAWFEILGFELGTLPLESLPDIMVEFQNRFDGFEELDMDA
ncbi:hypothetical protein BDP27DRAFT_1354618 [Rhodocollybia butyracea]|uniref:Uncharacterized protein n=1 Tax=Rhodocollybia butyracea TaxID=206335 RepID=A0A9P5TWF5_9AGAR|nr:hypothetical protein BDP27DRAFT_1354618 [Rhodocollybia butyracea]